MNQTDNNISKKVILVIATMTSFLTPFMGSSINIALPAIGEEFSMDAVSLSWVVSSYLLSTAVFLVPIGRIADIYGRKKILTFGIIAFTIFSFLLAITTSSSVLIVLRVLQGIGSAMIFGTGVAILTSVFPVKERGRALGINVASVYLGLSLGPFLGGILTHNLGWRSIFWVNVPLGLIVIFMILWKLKGEWAEAKGEKFDFIGSFIYGASLITVMYGLSILPDLSAAWFLLAGFLCLLAFIGWEMKTSSPVLNLNLFKHNLTFTFSNIAALINYSATFAIAFLLSLYLQYTQGMSSQTAGLVLIAQPIIMAIVSPIAGRLSDKIEPRIIASFGMGLTCAGLLYFTFIDAGTTMGTIIAGLVIIGAAGRPSRRGSDGAIAARSSGHVASGGGGATSSARSRSSSDHSEYGAGPPSSSAAQPAVRAPAARARSTTSWARRVLPIPASPRRTATPERIPRALQLGIARR